VNSVYGDTNHVMVFRQCPVNRLFQTMAPSSAKMMVPFSNSHCGTIQGKFLDPPLSRQTETETRCKTFVTRQLQLKTEM